ncbi:hypothetical protein YIM73518_15400 [Thermus brockianus]
MGEKGKPTAHLWREGDGWGAPRHPLPYRQGKGLKGPWLLALSPKGSPGRFGKGRLGSPRG